MSKPFDEAYVMALTIKNMVSAVDTSITCTVKRISEFEGNSKKSAEVLSTLAKLNNMRTQLNAFSLIESV